MALVTVDWFIIGWVLFWGTALGYDGLTKLVFGTAALVISVLIAWRFSWLGVEIILPLWTKPPPMWVGFLVMVVINFVIIHFVGRFFHSVFKSLHILWLDTLLGVTLGCLVGIVSAAALLAFVQDLPVRPAFPDRSWWRESELLPYLFQIQKKMVEFWQLLPDAASYQPTRR